MNDRIKSNITVIVPDLSAPVASFLEAFNKRQINQGEEPAKGMEFRAHGYVLTETGLYSFCTEGVGDSGAITDTNKLEIELYPSWEGRDSMMPAGSIELTDSELIMLPTLREVPMEEFIRSFGRRLESNYNVWLDHFRKNKPMTKEHA